MPSVARAGEGHVEGGSGNGHALYGPRRCGDGIVLAHASLYGVVFGYGDEVHVDDQRGRPYPDDYTSYDKTDDGPLG